jgi:hypothetical protein
VAGNWYVGELRYGITTTDLQDLFDPEGTWQSAQVIVGPDTDNSKGFGAVEVELLAPRLPRGCFPEARPPDSTGSFSNRQPSRTAFSRAAP